MDDVVSAMVAAATAPNLNGMVINIGSGEETSIRSLANLVLKVTGSQTNTIYNAQTSGGVSRLCANISLAAQKLNYAPSVSLEDGLRLCLQMDVRYKVTKELTSKRTK